MPILTAAVSSAFLSSCICTALVGFIAITTKSVENADAWSIAGAALGSTVTILEAERTARPKAHKIATFLISASAGALGPGMTYVCLEYFRMISPEFRAAVLPAWQWWAAAGLFWSMIGWWFIHSVLKRARRRIGKGLDIWIGPEGDPGETSNTGDTRNIR